MKISNRNRCCATCRYWQGLAIKHLSEVEVVAQDYPNEMSHNIKALKGVIPEDIKAGDIEFEMGAPWIPIEYYNQFFEQKFNPYNLGGILL